MTKQDETPSAAPQGRQPQPGVAGLKAIAVVKFVKGLLLAGLAVGFFSSINTDLAETVRKITVHLRIDPENALVRLLLEKIARISPKTLHTIGLVTVFYTVELFAEGVGLWLNQAWAKYLLVVATGFFLPWEAKRCIDDLAWDRVALLVLNLAAFVYVVWVLWRQRHPEKG